MARPRARPAPGRAARPDRRRRRRGRPRPRRAARPRRRHDWLGEERAAADARRLARRRLQPGAPHVRAGRLQGRGDVRRLRRPAAHRRAGDRSRRTAGRTGADQSRGRAAAAGAPAPRRSAPPISPSTGPSPAGRPCRDSSSSSTSSPPCAADVAAFVPALVGIAQRGRSLGIHLVLATQRPAGVVSDDIRANTNLRLALRLHDPVDARDVVGDDCPGDVPACPAGTGDASTRARRRRRLPGCPQWRDGAGPCSSTRSARVPALSDVPAPHRPWLPALPATVAAGELTSPGAVGIVDVPAEQRRARAVLGAGRWQPGADRLAWRGDDDGPAIAARLGVPPPAAVRRARLRRSTHRVTSGSTHWPIIPHCAGVVRPHERERLARLLRRLTGELDRRRAAQRTRGRR